MTQPFNRPFNRRVILAGGLAGAAVISLPLSALAGATYDVEMLNKHPDNKKLRQIFLPRILVVEPSDTVRFLPADKSHNSISLRGMVPEGAEGWKGKMNKEIAVTFDMPGFYGYGCQPHLAMGMVGLVIVRGAGMMANLETAKAAKHRGKSKGVWEEIWAEVDAMDFTEFASS